jgi:hypothetical protein
MKKYPFFIMVLVPVIMLQYLPALAIRVCHDYTYYRVFNVDPDPPGGTMAKQSAYYSADALRKELKKKGYNSFSVINSYQMPNFPKILKPGYVVIIEEAHSGFINKDGNVDHFLQMSKSVGTYYTIKDIETKYLAPRPNDEKGGLFLNDTWSTFIGRRFSPNPIGKIEIWRK